MTVKRTNMLAILISLMLPLAVVTSAMGLQQHDRYYYDDRYDNRHHEYDQSGHYDHYDRRYEDARHRERYRERRAHKKAVRIAPRHFPPAGFCRVWFPYSPPRHQPAPIRCSALRAHHVPRNAIVLTHRGVSPKWYRHHRPVRRDHVYRPVPRPHPGVAIRWDVRGGWIVGR